MRKTTLTDKVIFPSEKDRTGEGHFCYTKLTDLIFESYNELEPGDTAVVYSCMTWEWRTNQSKTWPRNHDVS